MNEPVTVMHETGLEFNYVCSRRFTDVVDMCNILPERK